ncbi:S8 family serine peptidase [Streptomyces sp. NPDC048664]|uniref:S8 family peptidase n=1 Tax=Streptomyces sp. NPDC048664 TaxID=3154505 RepID=UPI003436CCBE
MTRTGRRTRRRTPGRYGHRAVHVLLAVCALLALSAPAAPSRAAGEGAVLGAGAPGSVSGSYLVTLRAGVRASPALGAEFARRYGVGISHLYRSALNGYAIHADERRARRLAADPRVAAVAQDTRVASAGAQEDPPSWGLDRVDQRALPLDRDYTWPKDTAAGAGVTVYVIDTGVRVSHRDFGGRASYGWDFVDGDRTADDRDGHGTHVAGTIAGGRYGVAKRAKVVAVRVLDDHGAGTTAQVIAGIDWVTRHAHKPAVANLSLAGHADARLDAAVRASIASGVTYVVAAGNGDHSAAPYSPGRVVQALTVGAVDRADARARFSNWGPQVDLFAPGVAITSDSAASDTATATLSGTSMAAPHAAGAAALYLGAHPEATPAQVSRALVRRVVTGKVRDAGAGSPNKLLYVGGS